MIQEKVVITQLNIVQPGQVIHFDVKIPHDALRIIGIELSCAYPDPPVNQQGMLRVMRIAMQAKAAAKAIAVHRSADIPLAFTPSPYLGDLRLQSCESTNVFYSGDVVLADMNLAFGDYTIIPGFAATEAIKGQKRQELSVNTTGKTAIVKGIYRDRQAALAGVILPNTNPGNNQPAQVLPQPVYSYRVNLYVWYEIDITKQPRA